MKRNITVICDISICYLKWLILAVCVCCPTIAKAKDIKVATSFYPIYIMALNVTQNVVGVQVVNITPKAVGCLHDYSLTAADMKRLATADIFFTNGAAMESFIETVAGQFKGLRIVALSEGIPLIRNADGSDNPHVWVGINNAAIQVRNMGNALIMFDPGNALLYDRNTENYIRKLHALSAQMHSQLAPYANKKIVTFHEAFAYFAQEFQFDIVGVIEQNPSSVPSAKGLAGTIELVKRAGIKTLFAEPQYSVAAAEIISRETGAKIYSLDPAVTGPDSADAYETIMRANMLSIINAFKQE